MRRHLSFACADETLIGTLDLPDGKAASAGLLLVSGGNEIRSGAHGGQALLAVRIAAAGFPVMRYDRRGIGDSGGENGEFLSTQDDIAAAAATFRGELPKGAQIIGFGNCDAATALALFGPAAGIDRLILANPWVIEQADDLPTAGAIRSRYWEKLRNPSEILRLLTGKVNVGKLLAGLRRAAAPAAPSGLAAQLGAALAAQDAPVTLLLAKKDRTAQAFIEAWDGPAMAEARKSGQISAHMLASGSHSFAEPDDQQWLFDKVLEALSN